MVFLLAPMSIWHAVGFFKISLLLSGTVKHARLMQCIFFLSPRIRHFFKNPNSFYCRVALKTKIWFQSMPMDLGMLLASVLEGWIQGFNRAVLLLWLWPKSFFASPSSGHSLQSLVLFALQLNGSSPCLCCHLLFISFSTWIIWD